MSNVFSVAGQAFSVVNTLGRAAGVIAISANVAQTLGNLTKFRFDNGNLNIPALNKDGYKVVEKSGVNIVIKDGDLTDDAKLLEIAEKANVEVQAKLSTNLSAGNFVKKAAPTASVAQPSAGVEVEAAEVARRTGTEEIGRQPIGTISYAAAKVGDASISGEITRRTPEVGLSPLSINPAAADEGAK
ncbi:hypothetical protein NO2_0802 [Candidatus Termititenax persephonae]|uniref:Uncharacterized protein n=1 Tax=Candidatus Termititenax persephonae TaxID=2218525 RepID=A0A388THM0_9BACT|nr:hypothetical protein NO2_0802 [Candidatus Termititenax persephonae]